jgi:hypothetical protein
MSSKYLVNLENLKFKLLVDTQNKAAITGYKIDDADLNSIYEPYDGVNYGNATAGVTNYLSNGADLNTFFLNVSSVPNPVIESLSFTYVNYKSATTVDVGVLVQASGTNNDLLLRIDDDTTTTYSLPNNVVTKIPLRTGSRFITVNASNQYKVVSRRMGYQFLSGNLETSVTTLTNIYAFDLTMYGSGGSGGSGGNRDTQDPGHGSQGGSGGGIIGVISTPSLFNGTATYSVGSGGNGALGQTNNFQDGNDGNNGNETYLRLDNGYSFTCNGGNAGKGGSRQNDTVDGGAKGTSVSTSGVIFAGTNYDGNNGTNSSDPNNFVQNSPKNINGTNYSYGSAGGGSARGGGSGNTEKGGDGYLSVFIYTIIFQ